MYIYKVYSGFPLQLFKQHHLLQTVCIKELQRLKIPFPLLCFMHFDLVDKEMYMVYMKISKIGYWSQNELLAF
jgi:hypothetical protein